MIRCLDDHPGCQVCDPAGIASLLSKIRLVNRLLELFTRCLGAPRARGGAAGAKPTGLDPVRCPGAPRARPPERSGAWGPRERRRGGAAGAKRPGLDAV